MQPKVLTVCALLINLQPLLTACTRNNPDQDPQLTANLAAPYDYYIASMHSTRFDTAGSLQYTLSAKRATHFPTDNHAELFEPLLHWVPADGAPWTVTAHQGNLHQRDGADELTLYEDVTASTTLSQSGPVRLETSSLDLLPARKLAQTLAAVLLTTPSIQLQGSGLELDLSDNTIDLRNDVRGHYEP